jgi:futalosine hydrolase
VITPLIFRDLLGLLAPGSRLLVAVATPLEASAIPGGSLPPPSDPIWNPHPIADRVDLVITGVGKAPAAAAVASILAKGAHGGVLNAGIAGALPGAPPLPLLSVVIASAHAFADEGVAMPPEGPVPFQPLSAMGFAPRGTTGDAVPGDLGCTDLLRRRLPSAVFAPVATVSTCSGTDELASAVAARTGARAECMEGAAIALAARSLGCRYAEVRTISNTTGHRSRQLWDVRGAIAALSAVFATT